MFCHLPRHMAVICKLSTGCCHAESIAFYRGERREADVAGNRLRALMNVARHKVPSIWMSRTMMPYSCSLPYHLASHILTMCIDLSCTRRVAPGPMGGNPVAVDQRLSVRHHPGAGHAHGSPLLRWRD